VTFSAADTKSPYALAVVADRESLSVELSDGRTISVPTGWFPRLMHATQAERSNWRLIADGDGIHWPDLDEDIAVAALLEGRRSAESQASLGRWLDGRQKDGAS
jgi:hypothetical protein